jgi:hypothetical protein
MIKKRLRYSLFDQLHHISLGLTYLHDNDVMHGDLRAVPSFDSFSETVS